MSKHALERPPTLTPKRRRFGALLATFAIVATGATLIPANATTTVTPTEAGNPPVVRESSVSVTVDRSALYYWKGAQGATAAAAATALANAVYKAAPLGSLFTAGSLNNLANQTGTCLGNNTAAGGKDLSPRTTVSVSGPGGVVASATSPARAIGGTLAAPGDGKPISPQPAPGNSNYLGDFPAGGGPVPGFTVPVSLAGQPAGTYTVTTTNYNVTQASRTANFTGGLVVQTPGACVVGVPDATGKGVVPGPVTTTTTFEYRPWQQSFNDVLGHGSVNMNLTPKEVQATADGTRSAVFDGATARMRVYSSTDSLLLPPDPAACADNPASCVPSVAVECTGQPGCAPRIVVVNKDINVGGPDKIQGIFDLQTRAFIALVRVEGKTRVLVSLGSQLDALYGQVLAKAVEAGNATGIDVMRILTTEVKITGNGSAVSLSLLNGLQIDPSNLPGGLTITSGITEIDTTDLVTGIQNLAPGLAPTVQAGLIIHIAAGSTTGGTCAPVYRVRGTDLVPDVPSPGPLGALVGGPVRNVSATFPVGPSYSPITTAALGVDTAAGEPNGLPIWIEPIVSGVNASKTQNIDFIGTLVGDTVLDIAVPVSTTCIRLGGFIGAGVAVVNNPLPVGLKDLFDPLTTPNPALAPLVDAVGTAVDSAVDSATTNPAVAGLLSSLLALVPAGTLPTG
jgi:hypothetical protein